MPASESPPASSALKPPSPEQKAVLLQLLQGRNISIPAVAGAGKSTTLLLCARLLARAAPGKRLLLLTYNKRLEVALKARAAAQGLANLDLRTYHGAASFCYQATISTDAKLELAVRRPPPRLLAADVVMLDEAQDMTIAYSRFVHHLLAPPGGAAPAPAGGAPAKGPPAERAQLVVVGDARQAINQYKGARPEFLTQAHRLFDTGRPWVTCPLSTSYRLTPATAQFVNAHVLGEPLIVGGNAWAPSLRPRYLAATYRSMAGQVGAELRELIRRYGHENVAVIAPSVRSLRGGNPRNPLVQLVREHLKDVPLHVAASDEEALSEKVLEGKLVISSWHSMKGRESDCVVVLDFHERYLQYYEKAWGSRPGVPNIVYVAATRAAKQLVVVAERSATFRSVDAGRLAADAELVGGRRPAPFALARLPKEVDQHVGVLDLLRHADAASECRMLRLIERGGVDYAAAPAAPLAGVAAFRAPEAGAPLYSEDVARFYGAVVPRVAELRLKGGSRFGERAHAPTIVAARKDAAWPWDMTQAAYDAFPPDFWESASAAFVTACEDRRWADWFLLAVALEAVVTGRYHVARQIRHYRWVSAEFVDQCAACARDALAATDGDFEVALPARALPRGTKSVVVRGVADYVERGRDGPLWAFRCVEELTDAHRLQLACQLALAGRSTGRLYALRSGAIETIRLPPANAQPLLSAAMEKYEERPSSDIFADIARFLEGGPAAAPDGAGGEDEPPDGPEDGAGFSLDDLALDDG